DELRFGKAELIEAYSWFNTGKDRDVDFVVLGCPHASLEQIRLVASLLEGKRLSANTELWMFTPRSLRVIADRMGYSETLRKAGAWLMSDSCSALSKIAPQGTRVAATDSCKQAHYLPATMKFQTWLGTTEQCVNAAITGRWEATFP
ncbi:MAG: aconitase X, partial [Pseudomonadales bacterium]